MKPRPPEAVTLELLARLIHPSIVKSCSCRLAGLPILTVDEPVPSNMNAWPTKPGAKEVFPLRMPGLPPRTSEVSASAGHQLTRPGGATAQGGSGLTVKTALELTSVPARLDRVTVYTPACEI